MRGQCATAPAAKTSASKTTFLALFSFDTKIVMRRSVYINNLFLSLIFSHLAVCAQVHTIINSRTNSLLTIKNVTVSRLEQYKLSCALLLKLCGPCLAFSEDLISYL